jgi:hypothetical protein
VLVRRLGLLVATTGLAVTAAISLAGPAAAALPQTGEHDCRMTAVCWPGQHRGWDTPPRRNVGG